MKELTVYSTGKKVYVNLNKVEVMHTTDMGTMLYFNFEASRYIIVKESAEWLIQFITLNHNH